MSSETRSYSLRSDGERTSIAARSSAVVQPVLATMSGSPSGTPALRIAAASCTGHRSLALTPSPKVYESPRARYRLSRRDVVLRDQVVVRPNRAAIVGRDKGVERLENLRRVVSRHVERMRTGRAEA